MIKQRSRYMLVFGVLFAACGQRSEPLGKLPRSKLSDWAADCASPIVEEPAVKGKDPAMVGKRWREETFARATHRFVCKPPGWTVYADDRDRVVGFCVDDKMWPDPIEDYFKRTRRLMGQHINPEFAADITQGECSFEPESVPHGLLRWEQQLPAVINPDGTKTDHPNVGTLQACCWELKN